MFELYAPGLRDVAESRMGSANGASDAAVMRLTGNTVPDPFSGLDVPEFATVHVGPMRLAAGNGPSASARKVQVPGGELSLAALRADFPATTATFEDGDVIEVYAGESTGTRWVVVEAARADQQTAYRVPVVAYV